MICDICQCKLWDDDQQFKILLLDYRVCALCASASEKLGYRLTVIQ